MCVAVDQVAVVDRAQGTVEDRGDREVTAWRAQLEESTMRFRFVADASRVDVTQRDTLFLWNTDWDDWFQFATLHTLVYIDQQGTRHSLGDVKIGTVGLLGARANQAAAGERMPGLPAEFSVLSEEFFSLGQDDSYYSSLDELGAQFREDVLRGLRDIAFDELARRTALFQKVTTTSLLRSVTLKTVEDQFARMAHGGARLTPYSFSFKPRSAEPRPALAFSVEPGSRPPTNIHVLIGRNGVGKSTLLNSMAKVMVEKSRADDDPAGPWDQLSNIVSVSFSAFDDFSPMKQSRERPRGLTYHYVGLKKVAGRDSESAGLKDDRAISTEMTKSLKLCLVGARRARLRQALGLLESDPIFAEAGLADLLEIPLPHEVPTSFDFDEAVTAFGAQFRGLSSGHKIVLLSICRLVETVEEKSLVLLDEPEAHLHPPLLSAFVRALSDLLTNRNGMAIIATHSPVVLQEVPRVCVWKLSRSGTFVQVERPRIETFGENVGILTDEVFGLEVTSTGFHRMLADAALSSGSYEEALATFGGQLGSEGKSMLRAMMLPTHSATSYVDG